MTEVELETRDKVTGSKRNSPLRCETQLDSRHEKNEETFTDRMAHDVCD